MPKWVKIIIIIILALILTILIFYLLTSKTWAGQRYWSGAKRVARRFYYRITPKPRPTVKLPIIFYRQGHSLSCEAAALRMALSVKSVHLPEYVLINQIGFDPTPKSGRVWGNPYNAFVGNIDGRMMRTGYGVYWGPVGRVANLYRPSETFTGWPVQLLADQIAKGHPVIVWGYVGSGRRTSWWTPDGQKIGAVYGEHARVAFGFTGSIEKPTGFFLLDPIYGEIYWSTKTLLRNWRVFNYSGVLVK